MRIALGLLGCTLLLACGNDGGSNAPDDDSSGTSAAGSDTGSGGPGGSTTDEPGTTSGSADSTGGSDSSGGAPGGTPGCGLELPAGDGLVTLQVGANEREYLIVVPAGYDPNTPTPLVFAWHGRGGSHELARSYFGVEAASQGAAIFVYPQGLPVASQGGQTGWDLAASGIDVAFFDAMLEQLSEQACIDLDRVFSTGHSFGGYMSNALGCFRAEQLRAIGPVAGGPPFGLCQSESVAAWITHGTLDEVVPFSQGEQSRDALLERNGCGETTVPVAPDACVSYEGCTEGLPVTWCEHSETTLQGHMWPRFAGPAIWTFFDSLPAKG